MVLWFTSLVLGVTGVTAAVGCGEALGVDVKLLDSFSLEVLGECRPLSTVLERILDLLEVGAIGEEGGENSNDSLVKGDGEASGVVVADEDSWRFMES